MSSITNIPFKTLLKDSLSNYFLNLDGSSTSNIYDLVISGVEQPLLELIMQHTHGNQSQAAKLLGLSRSTLRKRLEQYGL
jgi:Fis family transcriptional regulator